jgi:hypothetical protein
LLKTNNFDLLDAITQLIHQFEQKPIFMKVKAHSNIHYNEVDDRLAKIACQSEELPIEPSHYFSSSSKFSSRYVINTDISPLEMYPTHFIKNNIAKNSKEITDLI